MKKILSALLIMCLLLGALPVMASANERIDGGTLGSLTWEIEQTDKGLVLTIGGTGAIPDYQYPDYEDPSTVPPWSGYFMAGKNAPAAAIIIEPGVTAIGNFAFINQGCMSLSIADTVTSIGESAFQYGGSGQDQNTEPMETLDIPGSVKEIKRDAFKNFGAKKIVMHEGTTTIGYRAFSFGQTEEIYLPASLTNVDFDKEYAGIGSNSSGYRLLTDIYYAGSQADAKAKELDKFILWLGPRLDAQHIHYNAPAPTPSKPTVGGFSDVYADAFYADAVKWAVENNITSGKGDGRFDPAGSCSRGEIVTFLWRAAGKPIVSGESFSDVPAGAFYEDAVKWAAKEGITLGAGGKFNPNGTCTRAEIVTFLWRANGRPTVSGDAFSDVPAGAYFEDAVKWAVKNEITFGAGGLFNSNGQCDRSQAVTFLYRAKTK